MEQSHEESPFEAGQHKFTSDKSPVPVEELVKEKPVDIDVNHHKFDCKAFSLFGCVFPLALATTCNLHIGYLIIHHDQSK